MTESLNRMPATVCGHGFALKYVLTCGKTDRTCKIHLYNNSPQSCVAEASSPTLHRYSQHTSTNSATIQTTHRLQRIDRSNSWTLLHEQTRWTSARPSSFPSPSWRRPAVPSGQRRSDKHTGHRYHHDNHWQQILACLRTASREWSVYLDHFTQLVFRCPLVDGQQRQTHFPQFWVLHVLFKVSIIWPNHTLSNNQSKLQVRAYL